MGERKGTNKYYPPDYDPKRGGLNKFMGTHALRERARKLHLGILIIRFEMPYNVWCEGCGNHVGMGVRYNAEKKQVGMYYTTPIFEFRMKCHLCDNYYVMRTDPEHFDYECVEGLRRQEKRWDMEENEQIASMEKEKSRKLAADAMYKLEHVESDQAKAKEAAPEMAKLEALQGRMKDDFARNQELRKLFRTRKKELKKEADTDRDLLARSSLDIKLVPESEEDVRLASLIAKYRTVETVDEMRRKSLERLDKKSIFASSIVKKKSHRKRPISNSGGTSSITSASSRLDQPSTSSSAFKSGQASTSTSSKSTGESSASTKISTKILSPIKAKNIESLKRGLREARLSSKLLKLDRDLNHQSATASGLVVIKKKQQLGAMDSERSSNGSNVNSEVTTSATKAPTNNLSLLMQSYGGSSDSGGESPSGSD